MHNGRLKMVFIGYKGFKRCYQCSECLVQCGIERRSHGKIPFCCGTHHVFEVRERGRVTYIPIPENCIYRQPDRTPIDKQTAKATF